MLAFVTGGTGFVGSNLVAGLTARGIHVRVLRRPTSSLAGLDGLDYETCIGDILDSVNKLTELMAGCTWVFHTAAISDCWRYRGHKQLYRTNIDGTRNMAAAALRAGVQRFVFTSSIGALGAGGGDRGSCRPNRGRSSAADRRETDAVVLPGHLR